RGILGADVRSTALFFTSNSFATEILRIFLLQDAQCERLTELQHGVPPVWEEPYFAALLQNDRSASTVAPRHVFVPQVPDLPMVGVFGSHRRFAGPTAVNAYLNKFLVDRGLDAEDFGDFVSREWRRTFPHMS